MDKVKEQIKNRDIYISKCNKAGIKLYPIYIDKTKRIYHHTTEKILKGNNWYIEVNNKGKTIIYEKSIGTGLILKGVNIEGSIIKTYKYLYNELQWSI